MFLLNSSLLIDTPSDFHKLNIILAYLSLTEFYCGFSFSMFGCNALWKICFGIFYLKMCKSGLAFGIEECTVCRYLIFGNFTLHSNDVCQWISLFGLLNIRMFNGVIQYLDCNQLSIRWITDLNFITFFFSEYDSFNHKPSIIFFILDPVQKKIWKNRFKRANVSTDS